MTEPAAASPESAQTPPAQPDPPGSRRTARLLLRPYVAADADALLRVYGRADVVRFLLDEPWTAALAAERVAERILRAGLDSESGGLALILEHEGTVIGDVDLWLTDRAGGIAEIGWVLDPDFGGRGFAGEAAAHLLTLGFAEHGLHRIVARLDARNTASARLAERLGMTREAHLRQDWWSKGEWTDTVVYGMLASDLPEPQQP